MGFTDIFKRKRNNTSGNEQPQQTAAAQAPAGQGLNNSDLIRELEARQAADTDTESGFEIYDSMRQLRRNLSASEKGGRGSKNSDKYNAVESRVDEILTSLDQRLVGDPKADQEVYQNLMRSYLSLIEACKSYLNRGAWTEKGQARQGIVTEIQIQAEKDVMGLREAGDRISTLSERDRGGSLKEALANARRRTLKLRNGTEKDLPHVGGQVSYLGVLNKGDLTDESLSGYFKEEDIVTKRATDKEKSLYALDRVRGRLNLSDQYYTLLKNKLAAGEKEDKLKELTEYKNDPEFRAAVDMMIKVENNQDTAVSNLSYLGVTLQEGESFRLSDRNVATSRVANMLGIGDVVAQSETAELQDAGSETSRKGNLMQKGKGVELRKYVKDQMRTEFYENWVKTGKNIGLISGVSSKVTPAFMKSMSSLQVLDNLTGQTDRHWSNLMVDVQDGGMMGAVQGIDNDFAFGRTNMKGGPKGNGYIGTHGRAILNSEGKLNLPHMDAGLAARIENLKEGEVRLMLSDVLEDWAIDEFWERVRTLQKAIRRDKKENPDSGRYLTEDEEWNDSALKDFRENTISWNNDLNPTSYISDALAYSENDNRRVGGAPIWADFSGDSTEVQEAEKMAARKKLNK